LSRLAVILHGIVGGTAGRNGIGAPIDIETCAQTIKHNVISKHGADVFIHSWSTEHQDAIIDLYNPVVSQFQPQEYFGYNFNENTVQDENQTHAFRTISRYNSLYRAMELKKDYEQSLGFKYDWVLVIRFDLIIFNPIDLNRFNNNCFYICSEPHWKNINQVQMVHDIAFLSGSNLMDTYCEVTLDLQRPPYKARLAEAHRIAYFKLHSMFKGQMDNVGYAFHRYKDMEIYRMIMNPDLNELGKQFGELETKARLEKLLEEINGT